MKYQHLNDDELVYRLNKLMKNKHKYEEKVKRLKGRGNFHKLCLVKASLESIVDFFGEGQRRLLSNMIRTRYAHVGAAFGKIGK